MAHLAKSELNNIQVLISKTLINSNINHNEFVSKSEHDHPKEEITVHQRFSFICKTMLSYCLKYRKKCRR